jgi:hypothetical protein
MVVVSYETKLIFLSTRPASVEERIQTQHPQSSHELDWCFLDKRMLFKMSIVFHLIRPATLQPEAGLISTFRL